MGSSSRFAWCSLPCRHACNPGLSIELACQEQGWQQQTGALAATSCGVCRQACSLYSGAQLAACQVRGWHRQVCWRQLAASCTGRQWARLLSGPGQQQEELFTNLPGVQAQLVLVGPGSCSLLWQLLACHTGQSCRLQAPPPPLGSTQAVPASPQGTRAVPASTPGEGSSPAYETQQEGSHWAQQQQQQQQKQSSERLGEQRPPSHGGMGGPGAFGAPALPPEMQAALQHHQHQQLMGQMLLGSMGLPGMAPPGMGVHPGMAQLAVGGLGGMGGMGMPYPGFPAPYGPYSMGGFGNPYAAQPGPGSMPGPPMGPPLPQCPPPPGLDPMTAWYMHHYGRFMAAAHHQQQQTQSGQGGGTAGGACLCPSMCTTKGASWLLRSTTTADTVPAERWHGRPACTSMGRLLQPSFADSCTIQTTCGCISLYERFALPSHLRSPSACADRAVQQHSR